MYNLLITEDEEEIRAGIKSWLKSQTDCYNILTAKNGVKALEIMENVKIDFILLDMQMPVMDGISFLKELKKRNVFNVVIVVLSGFGEFNYAQAALEYGAIKYILKPITPDEILKVANEVKTLLDKNTASALEVEFLREHMKKDINIEVFGKIPQLSFDVTEFIMDLRMGQSVEIKNKVDYFFKNYRKYASEKGMDMVYVFVSLVNAALISASNEAGIQMCDIFSGCTNPFEEIYKIENVEETETWLLNIISRVNPYISDTKGKRTKGIIKQAKIIINNNYMDNITPAYLSQQLFLNKDYLGRIFKDSAGFSVNDYLNRVRIEKAKELLQEGKLKIYEVAQQVGIMDEHYFSTIFKKITGKTPSEYK